MYELSDKYLDFLLCHSKVDVLEGTTFAGKTTVGIQKFMFKVAASLKKLHIIAGKDLGTVEKNIINSELGLVTVFGANVIYCGNGDKDNSLPHIKFSTPNGIRIIYVLGYDDKTRWKKALGGQYGCVFIDEGNIADMDFIREISIRQDYMLITLNPDNPDLDVYSEYINHARPHSDYVHETPPEMLEQLNQELYEGWYHWYFTFDHNKGLTEEKRAQLFQIAPKGSKLYKNKILGLRGRATGLVFSLPDENITDTQEFLKLYRDKQVRFDKFTCGVDTSYSQNTSDKFVFIYKGITTDRKSYTLDEYVINNKDRVRDGKTPVAPSDIPPLLFDFLEWNRALWGFTKNVFIDSADSATIGECDKYKRQTGCIYNFIPAWKQLQILDRINLTLGWIAQGYYYILSHCKNTIAEFNCYSWKEGKDGIPEDSNDHCINADQYAWIPFKHGIGFYNTENKNGMV